MSLSPQKVRANERIRSPQIRLIGAAGEQFGIVTPQEGLARAQEAGLDLVEVAAATTPPVCRIMDLGKYLYTLGKKEKESRKKQKTIDIKEVKMTTKIDDHDYQTKLRNARRFIERGDKVKLVVFFRGREIVYVDKGRKLVDRFVQDLSDVAMIERNDGLEGKAILLYLTRIAPVKKKENAPASSTVPASPSAGPAKTAPDSH
ncbi:MAG TPA: translation initiation factor IF-3 [Candidatus Omnitrophota bacterium]|nr:translation initiation factor IF-3 [Candidatus Omnitrophota bacterium]HRY85556.1 translation initiation factor IF-3 [Candidatus Omnitrophota bacterium]